MSAEDAVAKAKAIAAKLTGSTSNGGDNAVNALDVAKAAEAALAGLVEPSLTKRKRWDEDPGDDSKKSKGEASRRLWISTKEKPASHYRLYWEQHGASITNQVSAGDIHLELKGRGSSATAALPGIPEEPLHLLIQGPTVESCESAEPLVDQLFVQKADLAALLAEDSPQEASQNTVSATTSSGYRPAPVASLIHNVNNGAMNVPDGQIFEEEIGVPNGLVGYIIGRGGESISSMQARSGAKVQIQREAEMAPGATQRVITLSGTTKQAIDACRSIIERMVQDRTNSTQQPQQRGSFAASVNASSQEARLQQAVEAGHVLVKVAVPNTDVGLIIGKAGTTIKSIQDRSGANIQIPQSGDVDNPSIRTVSITHPHGEGAQLAKQLIEDVLGSKKNQAAHVTIQVEIPDKDVGMCIGRSGCVIREMQNQSGTKIQIPSVPTPGQPSRIATIFGPPEGCEKVKQMIERIVLEQSSQSVMSGQQHQHGYGDAHGQYGQQQQQAYGGAMYDQQQQAAYGYQQAQAPQAQPAGYNGMQQSGQQDYSKEWAAYYAAQGASQGGTAVAAAASTPAATPQAAATSSNPDPAVQQGADAYYEQFHRYAYYYGEDAARNYYGAWSPPPGTPNPYGTNPNGITAPPASSEPAPAASAPAAPVAAPTQAPAVDPSSVRDTGRRGVSNLPAWMTKT